MRIKQLGMQENLGEKYKNINKNSIGIELVNKGHRHLVIQIFKKKQISSLIKFAKIY